MRTMARRGLRLAWLPLRARALATADGPPLPRHIKFRMPDLDFQAIGSGAAEGATLHKWHVREGERVRDGAQMCEIDTPDLNFVLEAGDEGFIARILVPEGTSRLKAAQPLAIIVESEEDVQPFLEALRDQPHAIEGYVETGEQATPQVEVEPPTTPPTAKAEGSDVLRVLHKLQKEGRFEDEARFKVLKSLARKNDPELLNTFRGSFEDGVMEEAAFDKDFFVDNALDLAEEAAKSAGVETKEE